MSTNLDTTEAVQQVPIPRIAGKGKCAGVLRDWHVTFDGAKANASEYLITLNECREDNEYADEAWLTAIPSTLSGEARKWYRKRKAAITTWTNFVAEFKERFFPEEKDQVDLWTELVNCEQKKNQSMLNFVEDFLELADKLEMPLEPRILLALARKQVHVTYVQHLASKRINSFEDLKEAGKEFEMVQKEIERKMKKAGKKSVEEVEKNKKREENIACVSIDSGKSMKKKKKTKKKMQKKGKTTSSGEEVAMLQVKEEAVRVGNPQKSLKTPGVGYPNPPASSQQGFAPQRVQTQEWQVQRPRWRNRPRMPAANNFAMQRQAAFRSSPPRASRGHGNIFYGTCYVCQVAGHRANECPSRKCYTCGQGGHYSVACPSRQPSVFESCQVCNRQGVVFDDCPNCTSVRTMRENMKAARKSRHLSSA